MKRIKLTELTVFAMLTAVMFLSKQLMEALPNVHLLGMFIVAITVVYRSKALFPIYGYVLLQGLIMGFSVWWLPNLYVWTVLWGMAMLLPRKMPKGVAVVVYMAVCGLHGFLYGSLWAPAQALFFGLDFKGMITWIIAGLPFDIIHGVSNIICGILILPVASVLSRAEKIGQN